MPSNDLDATVLDGVQQIIQDREKAVMEQQIAKREVHHVKQQLAGSMERCIELEKKVSNCNSFAKRYNVYKEEVEKVLDADQCSAIRSKARADATDNQKVFLKKFEQEKVEHEAALEAHNAKFAEERVALKKKFAASSQVSEGAAHSSSGKGKKAGKKDPDAPKRSCVASAYSRYVGDKKVKEAYKKGQEDGSITEKNLFTYAASIWSGMTIEDKKPYNDAQKADKAAKDLATAADGSKKSAGGKRKKAASDDDDDSPAEGDAGDEEPAPKAAKPDKPDKPSSSSKPSSSKSKPAKPEATNGRASKQTKLKVVPAAVPAKQLDSDDEDDQDAETEVKEASDDDDDDDKVPAAEEDSD